MRRTSATLWTSRVAAFMAVALLAFAGVKSTVMQVAMAAAANPADCGMSPAEMAAMGGAMQADPFTASPPKAPAPTPAAKPVKTGEVCGFCVDAAHAPLVAQAEPLRPPSAVAFIVPPARPPLGARAPPAFAPKARGPPQALLTA